MSRRVLIVDDEKALADTLSQILARAGYECRIAHDGVAALTLVDEFRPALVISDVVMPSLDGVELAKKLRAENPDCAVLLISGNAATQELLDLANGQGHRFQVLAKPVPPRELLMTVADMISGGTSSHEARHVCSPSEKSGETPSWKEFVEGVTENSGAVRPLIAGSWVRSRQAGVIPQSDGMMLRRIDAEELKLRLQRNERMIEAAKPLLQEFTKAQGSLKHVICLTDGDGIILYSTGNDDLMLAYGLGPGFDWSERVMGTNGMGTAISEDQPVAVIGPEHYRLSFHQIACLDSPVHDREGKIKGVVNFSMAVSDADPRQLVDIVSLAKNLERALVPEKLAPTTVR